MSNNVVNSLDKKMIDKIQNYSKEVTHLSFRESVLENIGMYLGSLSHAYITMIREVFQNAFDELMRGSRGKSPCDMLIIYYNEVTKEFWIKDNGRGIPFTLMIDIYSQENTSSNYTKEDYDYSSGKHGLGAKLTNFMSDKFIVESSILGESRRVEFNNGVVTKNGVYKIKNNGEQGTYVYFHPSVEKLGIENLGFTCKDVLDMIVGITFLGKRGKVAEFHGVTADGKKFKTDIVNKDGILSDLYDRIQGPVIPAPIYICKDNGKCRIEAAFSFDAVDMKEDINCYANYSHTVDGTHLVGFKNGVTKFFCNYMNKIYLSNTNRNSKATKNSKSKPLTILSSDVLMGIKGIISACVLKPIFGGQAKETITNVELKPFVNDAILEGLDEWAKSNPNHLTKICEYIKNIAKMRISLEKEKVKIGDKYTSNGLSHGLPAKYLAPTGTENLELIIVEGDSAAGSTKNTRKKAVQGILPIRGKMPNAFNMSKANIKKYLENAEIQGIINIISGGTGKWGEKFTPDMTNYTKIIIMSDADQDGDHIAVLVLTYLAIFYPRLVEAGMVYRAVAPLYGIPKGKGKQRKIERFFTTRKEYTEWLYNRFSKNNVIMKDKTHKLTPMEAKSIILNNSEYCHSLTVFKDKYAIDQELLERVIFNIVTAKRMKKDMYKYMKDNIEKDHKYRFIKVNKTKNGIIVIKGEYNDLDQTIILSRDFMNDLSKLIEMVENNSILYFNMNGKIISLYGFLDAFDKSAPDHILRYKGLGQMNATELQQTVLHPDMDRILIRYTFDSLSEDIQKMRSVDADKSILINGRKNNREDLMD